MEGSQQIGESRPFLLRARFHSHGNIGAPLFLSFSTTHAPSFFPPRPLTPRPLTFCPVFLFLLLFHPLSTRPRSSRVSHSAEVSGQASQRGSLIVASHLRSSWTFVPSWMMHDPRTDKTTICIWGFEETGA